MNKILLSLALILPMSLFGDFKKQPIPMSNIPEWHSTKSCDTDSVHIRFLNALDKDAFNRDTFYVLDNDVKLKGVVTIYNKFVSLKLDKPLSCNGEYLAVIKGVNYLNEKDTLQWFFYTNNEMKPKPKILTQEVQEESITKAASNSVEKVIPEPIKEEITPPAVKVEKVEEIVEIVKENKTWFAQVNVGVSMFDLESSISTVEAENTRFVPAISS